MLAIWVGYVDWYLILPKTTQHGKILHLSKVVKRNGSTPDKRCLVHHKIRR